MASGTSHEGFKVKTRGRPGSTRGDPPTYGKTQPKDGTGERTDPNRTHGPKRELRPAACKAQY